MDKRMARPTDVNPPRLHILFVEILFEPLVGVALFGYEVVERDAISAPT